MKRLAAFLALALTLIAGSALAQSTATPVVDGQLQSGICPFGLTTCFVPGTPQTPLQVLATTFSSSASTTLSATTTTGRVALPANGSVVEVTNGGAVSAYVNLGGSTVTATTANLLVPAGQAVFIYTGTSTYLAGITASSTASLTVAEGVLAPISGSGGTSNVVITGPLGAGADATGVTVTLATSAITDLNSIVTNTGIHAVTNAGTFAVQNTAATPAGSAIIGKVGIDQTTPGTTNGVQTLTGSTTAVTGTVTVSGAVFGPTADGSPAANPPVLVGGTVDGTATGVLSVMKVSNGGVVSVDGSSVTQPVSGTVSITANSAVNEAQINGVTPLMGNGVTGTGSQRVTIASDNTAFSVNGTLQTQTDTVMIGGVNIKEINAVTPLMGNGVTGTGSQRVTIASDNTAFSVNATPIAATSGGLSNYTVIAAASDNHVVIKNGATTAFAIQATNNSATVNYVRLYNVGTGFNGCNSATSLVWGPVAIPASTSGAGFSFPVGGDYGIAFGTGLSICITSGFSTTDTTNATATALSVQVQYK